MLQRIISGMLYRFKRLVTKKQREDFYQVRPSLAIAAEIWKSNANDRLIDLTLAAVPIARKISHLDISEKMKSPPYWPEIWPGEKYKLLTALITVLDPTIVIEIGTSTGLSARSMKKTLPANSKIYTFDLRPWNTVNGTVLSSGDFDDGRLVQVIDDLSDKSIFTKYAGLLRQASVVFIDVGNDDERREEKLFLENFANLDFATSPIFVLSDIRLMGMVTIWQNLQRPKLDVTSFGHWSGTGLVDWKGRELLSYSG